MQIRVDGLIRIISVCQPWFSHPPSTIAHFCVKWALIAEHHFFPILSCESVVLSAAPESCSLSHHIFCQEWNFCRHHVRYSTSMIKPLQYYPLNCPPSNTLQKRRQSEFHLVASQIRILIYQFFNGFHLLLPIGRLSTWPNFTLRWGASAFATFSSFALTDSLWIVLTDTPRSSVTSSCVLEHSRSVKALVCWQQESCMLEFQK